jgi:hypothetical protein
LDNREFQFHRISQLGGQHDDTILFFPPINELFYLQLIVLNRCAISDGNDHITFRMALMGDEISVRVEDKNSIRRFIRNDYVNGGPFRLASACWLYTPSGNCMGWQSLAEGWMVLRVSATVPVSSSEILRADRRFARHYIQIGNHTQPSVRQYTFSVLQDLPPIRRDRLMKWCGIT